MDLNFKFVTYSLSLWKVFKYFLVVFVLSIVLFPLMFLISFSLFSDVETHSSSNTFIPKSPQFSNYSDAFSDGNNSYINVFWYTLAGSVWTVFLKISLSFLSAYALHLMKATNRKYFFLIFVIVSAIPSITLQYGLRLEFKHFNWTSGVSLINALVIPNVFTLFSIGLFLQGLETISKTTRNVAKIDNLNLFNKIKLVYLPSLNTQIWVTSIFATLSFWNSFVWPTIILAGKDESVLAIWFRSLGSLDMDGQRENIVAAGSVLSLLPLFITYLVLSKKVNKVVASLI